MVISSSQQRQHSCSINCPTKKLGCLGGSADMTHNRRSAGQSDIKADMASYEKEMRSRKVQSQTDKMNSGLGRQNSGSQERGRTGASGVFVCILVATKIRLMEWFLFFFITCLMKALRSNYSTSSSLGIQLAMK